MLQLFISNAYAQGGAAAPANSAMNFVPIIAVVAIFYFLVFRPQKKQMEEEKKMLDTLEKGNRVYTKSGIFGTIVGMTEKVVDLEVAEGTRIKILRSQLGGLEESILSNKKEA
ncbi:preprotein translocase subunit YajC [Halobacteriovorax sp. ZH4_bin.1]|uniref:preprotein translocase subunit YajC n=1 Tax=unclassified Halobacteriovorax TaxID=2639665 RepID=UPI00371099F0